MTPLLNNDGGNLFVTIMGLLYVLALGLGIAGFVFSMLTMLATRRTAKATEALLAEVAQIKVELNKSE